MERGPFIYLRSNPSMCSSCSPTQLLLAMKPTQPLPDDTTMLDPANEQPSFHCRPVSKPPKTQTSASVSPHRDTPEPATFNFLSSVPATGPSKRSTLAPTFTPPITYTKATIKCPSPPPPGIPDPTSFFSSKRSCWGRWPCQSTCSFLAE